MPTVKLGPNAKPISTYTESLILQWLAASGNPSCIVSRTIATPEDQARAMWELAHNHGAAYARALYSVKDSQGKIVHPLPGSFVIDVYERDLHDPTKSVPRTLADMATRIRELGPEKVSHHCGDPTKLGVVDIAPSSLKDAPAFEAAVEREHPGAPGSRVSKFLRPGSGDPAFHVEVPQPPPSSSQDTLKGA